MACSNCDYQGYIENYIYRDAGLKPSIEQCPKCRDTARYSAKVQEMLGSTEVPMGTRRFRVIPGERKESDGSAEESS